MSSSNLAQIKQRIEAQVNDPENAKKLKYAASSVVAVGISLIVFALFNGPMHQRAWQATFWAFVAATLPTYFLNRKWAWGKSGKSSFRYEVLPFWLIAFAGLLFNLLATGLGERYTERFSHPVMVLANMFILIVASGVFWVIRYRVLNNVLFAEAVTQHSQVHQKTEPIS